MDRSSTAIKFLIRQYRLLLCRVSVVLARTLELLVARSAQPFCLEPLQPRLMFSTAVMPTPLLQPLHSAAIVVGASSTAPGFTNATTNENTQSSSGLVLTPPSGYLAGYFQITGIAGGKLYLNDGATQVSNGAFVTTAQGAAGLRFTPNSNSIASGSVTAQYSSLANLLGLLGSSTTATVTVQPVPQITAPASIAAAEDTALQLGGSNAIQITDPGNNSGTATVTLAATTGSLTLASTTGLTILSGTGANDASVSFSGTFANIQHALTNMTFTPAAGSYAATGIQVTASEGSNVATDSIPISLTRIAHTPTISNATTLENTQSSSGLVVTLNPLDNGLAGYLKINGLQNGHLFLSDGVTPVNNGNWITFAQGQAGLTFTPNSNTTNSGSFTIQAANTNADSGLSGSVVTATITVQPVPQITAPASIAATEDTSLQLGGSNAIQVTDPGNNNGTATVTLAATTGSLTLASTTGLTILSGTGANDARVSFSGTFGNIQNALNNMTFTPAAGSYAATAIQVTASEGSNVTTDSIPISITRIAHTPTISNATTLVNTQTTSGLVMTPSPFDVGFPGYVKINGITQGHLFLSDGVTPVNNGNWITFAQAEAGFTFTPNNNTLQVGRFTIQASNTNADGGLEGAVVTATISVLSAPLQVLPAAQTVNEESSLTFSSAAGNALSFNDANNPAGPATVTLSSSGGTFTLASTSGITINSGAASGSSSLSFTGTFANLTAAVNGLVFTPTPHTYGSTAISVSTTEGLAEWDGSIGVTVNRLVHTPTVTNATTNENTQTTSGLVIAPSVYDSGLTGYFQITNITGGSLFLSDGTTAVANGSFITFAQGQAGLKFTPASNSIASGGFTVQASSTASTTGLGGTTVPVSVTVLPVPSLTAPVAQSLQEEVSLTFSSGNGDAITLSDPGNPSGNATLSLSSSGGTFTLASTAGLTFVSGAASGRSSLSVTGTFANLNAALAGLVFTPTPHTYGSTSVSVSGQEGSNIASGSVPLTINRVVHTPTVSNSITNENTQSTSGLVITPASYDSGLTGYFQITNITGGSLFLNDATTAVANGSFITFAQGSAGLKFTPAANSTASGSFSVQASSSNSIAGLGGSAIAAVITVQPVPFVASPSAQNVQEEASLTFASGNGNAITLSDPGNPSGNATLSLSSSGGTFALASTAGLTFVSGVASGSSSMSVTGSFANLNAALAGLVFTPTPHTYGSTSVSVAVQEGSNIASGSVPVAVQRVVHTPAITNTTTNENVQSTLGLVITPSSYDGGLPGYFKISGISGGTLFQHDSTTAIPNGSFITFAQGQAGLKFTPASNSIATGSFAVQASLSASNAGLGGSTANASVTVSPVPAQSLPGPQSVAEDASLSFSSGGGNAIVLSDPGNPNGVATLTLSASAGSFTLASSTGLQFSLGQLSGSSQLTVSGSFADLNGALNGLVYQPALHAFGAASIAVSVSEGSNVVSGSVPVSIARVAHTPTVSSAVTNENAQSTAGLIVTPSALDAGMTGYLMVSGITGGTLYQNDGTTVISNGSFITFAQGQVGLKFTPDPNSIATGGFSVQASTSAASSGLGGSVAAAQITVRPVPLVAVPGTQSFNEDTTLGLSTGTGNAINVSDPGNPGGTAQVTVNANNGTVALATTAGLTFVSGADGSATMTFSGTFAAINTALDGAAFTPVTHYAGTNASIYVSAAEGPNSAAGSVALTINRVAHTPSITDASTSENVQTTSGLVVTPDPADAGINGYYQVTGISGGSLFQADGATPISNGQFITFAQGQAGLRFTPAIDSTVTGTFNVQGATQPNVSSLVGDLVAPRITVYGVPRLALPASATTNEDTALPFTGPLAVQVSDPGAPGAVVSVSLSVDAGTLSVASLNNLSIDSGANGSASMQITGALADLNVALSGLTYLPDLHAAGTRTLSVSATEGSHTVAGTTSLSIVRVAHTPSVTTATTNENQPTANGAIVLTPGALDTGLAGYFQISSIAGGTLVQADGTTPIPNGSFITFAQGQAGLIFVPTANSTATGSFSVRASTAADASGLAGNPVSSTITVQGVPDLSAPASVSSTQDQSVQFGGTQSVKVADPGSSSAVVDVTLSITHGVLSLASTANLQFVNNTANHAARLSIRGAIADVNQALSSLSDTPSPGYSGADTLNINVLEGSNSVSSRVALDLAAAPSTPSNPQPPTIPTPPTPPPVPPTPPSTPGPTAQPNRIEIQPPPQQNAPAAPSTVPSSDGTVDPATSSTSSDAKQSGTDTGSNAGTRGGPSVVPRSFSNNQTGASSTLRVGPARVVADLVALQQAALYAGTVRLLSVSAPQVSLASGYRLVGTLLNPRLAGTVLSPSNFAVSRASAQRLSLSFRHELDALHNRLSSVTPVRFWAGTASAVSAGASLLYFFWALRAGSLVSSLLSSMPVWNTVDPLPILESMGGASLHLDAEEDKGLEQLVAGGAD